MDPCTAGNQDLTLVFREALDILLSLDIFVTGLSHSFHFPPYFY